MILHIPHSSDIVPDQLRAQIVLSDDELRAELLRMTDAFTDELFAWPEAAVVCFPISRLLVDVERFVDDSKEPMSKLGMGVIYTRTAHGAPLRRPLRPEERKRLLEYYNEYHKRLSNNVRTELEEKGSALIVDCHSFPSHPLPCDKDQVLPRPVFCVGTDSFYTPERLIQLVQDKFETMGYSVGVNHPYEGAMVPKEFCRKNPRVKSIMIEVNRSLYMNEITGKKKDEFVSILSRPSLFSQFNLKLNYR